MPIELICSSCGAKYMVNERFAGKKAKCRQCGALMQVPGTPPATITGSSPMLDSPIIDRPVVPASARPIMGGSEPPQPRPMAPRPMPMPQPTPRAASPNEPLILSSNAAEYVQGPGDAPKKHWSKHLSLRTWIIIGVVAAGLMALGLILIFDPSVIFPTSLPAPKH